MENHSNVHKLAALVATSPPHFFYTQSCNQSLCPGLRRIRQWILSSKAHHLIKDKYNLSSDGEAQKILRDSVAPYIHRSWNVVIDLWMRYIVYSSDEPLHAIEWAWWRREFQDKNGNLDHVHALLRTKLDMDNKSNRQAVLDKIRGSL